MLPVMRFVNRYFIDVLRSEVAPIVDHHGFRKCYLSPKYLTTAPTRAEMEGIAKYLSGEE